MNSNPLRILLTGATGYVGGRLLARLIQEKYSVRCLSRNPSSLHRHENNDVEIVQGDVLDKSSLLQALEGIDVAFYLVHSMGSPEDFQKKDRIGAQNFGEACAEAGVKRIIYLGGLGESRKSLSQHLESRHEVGEILRRYSGTTQVIEFRASIIIGAGSLSFEMIRALSERLPVMITPRWVWTKAQPIYIDDVLAFLTRAVEENLENSPIFEIGGEDRVSYGDLMREYAKMKGLTRLMLPVPLLTPFLSSLWLGLVTPLYARVGRKLVESACYPTIVEDPRANQLFGIEPLGFQKGLKKALEAEEKELSGTPQTGHFSDNGVPKNESIMSGNRLVDQRRIDVNVPPQDAFRPIARIGGDAGFYFANPLWKLRGMIDLLAGGVGYRRGRRDAENIRVGDAIDFWRVVDFIPGRFLRLQAEMKIPGRAWLEFHVEGTEFSSTIRQKATFDPRGLFGILYWYLLFPFHRWIFRGMLQSIARKAREEGGGITEEERQDPLLCSFFFWSRIPASSQKVYDWHARPDALLRLIPPWDNIQVVEREPLSENSRVILNLTSGPFSCRWIARHIHVVDGKEFADIQEKGPFRSWKHIHSFHAEREDSSILCDSIFFRLPFGRLGKYLGKNWVRKKLARLFLFRHRIIREDFERSRRGNDRGS